MNILVIVAHPDDEILGAGGAILKHTQKGDIVKIIYLATGITSRRKSGHHNISSYESKTNDVKHMKKEIEDLRNDARKACSLLKVKNVKFYEFPDNEMDSIPLLKVVKTIETEIEMHKPTRVYTHHYGDLNVDHQIVYEATLTACRPVNTTVKELICFEIPSSTEWNYPITFNPNYFINIKSQLEIKIKAMEAYKNEIRKFPHPRSSENLRVVAKRWGGVSGNEAAEAFEIIRMIEK